MLVAKALSALIAAGAPERFDSEEAQAFMSTLKGHRLRMVGYGSPASPAAIMRGELGSGPVKSLA